MATMSFVVELIISHQSLQGCKLNLTMVLQENIDNFICGDDGCGTYKIKYLL